MVNIELVVNAESLNKMITDLIDYWNVDVAKSLMMGDNSDLLAASKSNSNFIINENFNLIKKL